MIESDGLEVADKVIEQWEIDNLDLPDPPDNSLFSKSDQEPDMKTVEQLQQEMATKDARIAELEAQKATEAKTRRQAEITAFCESDTVKKKLNESGRVFVAEFMAVADDVQEFEFSEGDAKKKKTAVDALKGFVLSLPDAVEFSEVATDGVVKKVDAEVEAAERIAKHANQ